jgi:predicted amidohydrolase
MWSLEDVLKLITTNPARYMKFKNKGTIEVGGDADILILQRHTLKPMYLIARGEVVKTPTYTKRSAFGSPAPDAPPKTHEQEMSEQQRKCC